MMISYLYTAHKCTKIFSISRSLIMVTVVVNPGRHVGQLWDVTKDLFLDLPCDFMDVFAMKNPLRHSECLQLSVCMLSAVQEICFKK